MNKIKFLVVGLIFIFSCQSAHAKKCILKVEKDTADQNGNEIIVIPAGTYEWSSKGGVLERCADAAHEPGKENKLSLIGHVFKLNACKRQFDKKNDSKIKCE